MAAQYDLIVVGGGVAGSSLARRLASAGAKVLILERETRFHDRVRGETLQPWGVAELHRLAIADLLRPCSNELRWFLQIVNGSAVMRRDLIATTPHAAGMWTFYHPEVQEVLLTAAAAAGAEVRRGATVGTIAPGRSVKVSLDTPGAKKSVEARMVALCNGRNPAGRAELGFQVRRGSIPLFRRSSALPQPSKLGQGKRRGLPVRFRGA